MDDRALNNTISKRLNIDLKILNDLHAALAESIKDCAAQLDSVSIPGFGTFLSVKKTEQIISNDEGKRMLLPPVIELKFRSSVLLRKKLCQ